MPIRIKRFKRVEIDDEYQCRNPFCKKVFDYEVEAVDHEIDHSKECFDHYLKTEEIDLMNNSLNMLIELQNKYKQLTGRVHRSVK